MANHFCAPALFDCACDMDHVSVIYELLLSNEWTQLCFVFGSGTYRKYEAL